MDKLSKPISMYGEGQEKTTWEKREEHADGSYTETCVEKVSNGYIKTVRKCTKEGDDYKHITVKSIHQENPMEEPNLIEKLEAFLKGKA